MRSSGDIALRIRASSRSGSSLNQLVLHDGRDVLERPRGRLGVERREHRQVFVRRKVGEQIADVLGHPVIEHVAERVGVAGSMSSRISGSVSFSRIDIGYCRATVEMGCVVKQRKSRILAKCG